MKKVFFAFSVVLIFTMSLMLIHSTKAIRPNLTATCSAKSPWWTAKTHAKAKVTWGHWAGFGSQEIPHAHTFRFSLYARVADEPPDTKSGIVHHMSTKRGSDWRNVSVSGRTRWDGDAYASSSISDQNPHYSSYWSFCADPKP